MYYFHLVIIQKSIYTKEIQVLYQKSAFQSVYYALCEHGICRKGCPK